MPKMLSNIKKNLHKYTTKNIKKRITNNKKKFHFAANNIDLSAEYTDTVFPVDDETVKDAFIFFFCANELQE